MVSQERVAAESLAKSELEYVKSCDYQDATWSYDLPSSPPSWDTDHGLPAGYTGYSVDVQATCLTGHDPDDGIQQITVTVYRNADTAFTLVGYKVDRDEDT